MCNLPLVVKCALFISKNLFVSDYPHSDLRFPPLPLKSKPFPHNVDKAAAVVRRGCGQSTYHHAQIGTDNFFYGSAVLGFILFFRFLLCVCVLLGHVLRRSGVWLALVSCSSGGVVLYRALLIHIRLSHCWRWIWWCYGIWIRVFVVVVVVSTSGCRSLCFSGGGSWIWVMEVFFSPAAALVVVFCSGNSFSGGSLLQ
ncbi:hypothetical protein QL285_092999 [Trifolium repens]|nr:hypothetical protein QL285_092999 [Trifolium repens]